MAWSRQSNLALAATSAASVTAICTAMMSIEP
jgi:hypothetical protein